jgi:spermidine synthase
MEAPALSKSLRRIVPRNQWQGSAPGLINSDRESLFIDMESGERIVVHGIADRLYSEVSEFQKIDIFETGHLGRVLALDEIIQVAEKDEAQYHELLIHPAACAIENPISALALGGGDGCAVRELLKYETITDLCMVEIDSQVIDACKEHFSLINNDALKDPRLDIVIDEASAYLRENNSRVYDLIIADLTEPYDPAGISGELSRRIFSPEFYGVIKSNLAPKGVFVIQTGGVTFLAEVDNLRNRIINDLRSAFRSVKTLYQYIHSFDTVWTITLCSDHDYAWNQFDPDPILKNRGIRDLRHYDRLSHLAASIAPKNIRELLEKDRG